MMLITAGEDIKAGRFIVIGPDGLLYHRSTYPDRALAGRALEDIREGFRAQISHGGQAREDDA